MSKLFCGSLVVCMFVGLGVAHSEVCVSETFNVTYGCGDGNLVGTLPSNAVATYNQDFTASAITSSMCTPPDGYEISGVSVYVDGEEMAYFDSGKTFKYTFVSDCEIRPKYVLRVSTDIAKPYLMSILWQNNCSNYDDDNGAMTWTNTYSYGVVNGVAKCSTVAPDESTAGNIVSENKQITIEDAAHSGMNCYCKLSEPYNSSSPWVYYGASTSCTKYCATHCSYHIASNTNNMRYSVYSAIIKDVVNSNN